MLTIALSEAQLNSLHQASMSILSHNGVAVPHEGMLRSFADAGADVNFTTQHVRIPEGLVLRCLKLAGKSFTLYGRDLSRTAKFGQGSRNYNSSAGQASWCENPGGQRRYATLADVATAARFGDALPQLNIVGSMADPHELPTSFRCVAVMAEMLKHTTKPLHFWFYNRSAAKYLIELMIALRGSEEAAKTYPICYPFLEPISPLRFPFHGIDMLYETARLNLPVPIGPMAQMGLSSPMTMAGTMAQQNAEILAGLCITQLIQPGTPVCYGGICHAFDMRTTQIIFGGPEQAMMSVAMTQLGKWYGLPVYVNAGLIDAKCIDAQAGMEAGITLAMAASAGADIFGHLGIVGADQGASLHVLALQHEAISYIEHLLRPFDTSEEMLALGVIDEVSRGGNFIDHEHTMEHFRDELWFPRLFDRQYYQQWLESGAPDISTRIDQSVKKTLQTHTAEPMNEDLEHAIDDILTMAKRDLSSN